MENNLEIVDNLVKWARDYIEKYDKSIDFSIVEG